MSATGVALAPTSKAVVVGPLFTAYGFKYWYWVCSSDYIIAVPLTVRTSIVLTIANHATVMFGLLGALIMSLLKKRGVGAHERLMARLASKQISELCCEPNVVYQLTHLQGITFKRSNKLSGLVCPELSIENKTGNKQLFGMQPRDAKNFRTELNRLYPHLCSGD